MNRQKTRIIRMRPNGFERHEIIYGDGQASIQVPGADGMYTVDVDAEDITLLQLLDRTLYVKSTGYVVLKRRRRHEKDMFLHRYLMGAADDKQVDHENHNPLINTKDNLRICTEAENKRNQRKRKAGSSKYKGVDYYRGAWRGRVRYHGKTHWHKSGFATEQEAAQARDLEAYRLDGIYSYLNFPELEKQYRRIIREGEKQAWQEQDTAKQADILKT